MSSFIYYNYKYNNIVSYFLNTSLWEIVFIKNGCQSKISHKFAWQNISYSR